MVLAAFSGNDSVDIRLPRSQEDLLRLIGFLHLDHGMPDKAVVVFEALLAIAPEDLKLRLSLACALLKTGAAAKALETLDRLPDAETANQTTAELPSLFHLLRSRALVQQGRMPGAARSMRHFLRMRRAEKTADW